MTPFLVGTAAVVIMHDERGREQTLRAHAVELGDGGATIEAARPVEPGTLAWVDFAALRMSAIAHVCGCMPQGGTFRIGLRFSCPPMRAARRRSLCNAHMAGA